MQFDALVRSVAVQVTEGQETISARLEVDA
jgi:hypothetical protein